MSGTRVYKYPSCIGCLKVALHFGACHLILAASGIVYVNGKFCLTSCIYTHWVCRYKLLYIYS